MLNPLYFRHIDGGLYRFIYHARDADTAGPVVVYEHLWPFEAGIWVRRADEFFARFSPVSPEFVEQALAGDREQAQQAVSSAKALRRAERDRQ